MGRKHFYIYLNNHLKDIPETPLTEIKQDMVKIKEELVIAQNKLDALQNESPEQSDKTTKLLVTILVIVLFLFMNC